MRLSILIDAAIASIGLWLLGIVATLPSPVHCAQLRGGGDDIFVDDGSGIGTFDGNNDAANDWWSLDEDYDDFHPSGKQDDEEVLQVPNRDLMAGLVYSPLQCNVDAEIDGDSCLSAAVSFRSLVEAAAPDQIVVVPCGQCAVVDYTNGESVTLTAGLDIVGRLHFPATANVVINTTSIMVQGQLDITEPAEGNSIKVNLYGATDQYLYPFDSCGGMHLANCTDRKNLGTKPIVVAGGKLNVQARDASCPSWTRLITKVSDTELQVDLAFAECLKPGDTLLVTSDTFATDGDDTPTVASVDTITGIVTLDTAITRSLPGLSGPGEPEFAVEVASLTRSVIFEAQDDNPDSHIGAHLIVYHTPTVPQMLSGIRFDNFGQGGVLGRYPIHFHLSGDSSSIVSDNVINNSNQRCIVVHDTNGVTVDDNVAYKTSGHCFVTETGSEENNLFSNNLGSWTRLLQFVNGQSDSPGFEGKHLAATFWVRNMKNEFIGNVAAGSWSLGWWLEMKNKKGNMLYKEPVSSFRDNVAHSNTQNGLTTYKPGFQPAEGGVFDNLRIYKNNGESGAKFHITGVTIRNSLFADNKFSIRYGVWNSGVTLQDSKIIALSKDMKLRKGWSCPNTNSGVYASYNNYPHADVQKAIKLHNVTMERFVCGSKTINLYFDGRQYKEGMGNPIQASVAVTENDGNEKAKPSIPCQSSAKYVFLEDYGGGLSPISMKSEPGFLIRNSGHMKPFLPPDACEPLPYGGSWSDGTRCGAFCKNVCLRYFHIHSDHPNATKLVLSKGDVTYPYPLDEGYAKFRCVLPSGSYHGKFYDYYDNEVISNSVSVSAFRAPQCTDYADESSFVFPTNQPSSSPSLAPSVSNAPTITPDPVVRMQSDSLDKYFTVTASTWDTTRTARDPSKDTAITLKKVDCISALNYYLEKGLTKQCYFMTWEHWGDDKRFFAQTSKEWKNGIGVWGPKIYNDNYWFFEEVPCVSHQGDVCHLIRNALNGRTLYDHMNKPGILGASPSNAEPNLSSTWAEYRWRLIDASTGYLFTFNE